MIRQRCYSKVILGMMLIVCAVILIFQNIYIKKHGSQHAQKEDSIVQLFTGQLGILEEASESAPTNTLEEEDDEFNNDSAFLASNRFGHVTRQTLVLQERVFCDHHPEIVSPPPQG